MYREGRGRREEEIVFTIRQASKQFSPLPAGTRWQQGGGGNLLLPSSCLYRFMLEEIIIYSPHTRAFSSRAPVATSDILFCFHDRIFILHTSHEDKSRNDYCLYVHHQINNICQFLLFVCFNFFKMEKKDVILNSFSDQAFICTFPASGILHPDRPFTISELRNPPQDAPKLHKFTDLLILRL